LLNLLAVQHFLAFFTTDSGYVAAIVHRSSVCNISNWHQWDVVYVGIKAEEDVITKVTDQGKTESRKKRLLCGEVPHSIELYFKPG
jgi:hypothetical protein